MDAGDVGRRLNRVRFVVDGQPIPKARPRVTRHGTYTPPKTAAWEELVGWSYKQARGPLFEGLVSVSMGFYRKTHVKVDADNLVKGLLDGLGGVAFHNDSQVRHIVAYVVYGSEEPRAEVIVKGD